MKDALTASARPYALSFTTGGLLTREASLLAPVYLDERDWGLARDRAVDSNVLQARTHSTGVRLVRETIKRLSALTDPEIELLIDLTASERSQLMWAAACRCYLFIGEFAEEVVRERYLTLASTVSYEDFDSFARAKALWHEELATAKASTFQKLRSNVFKMLREADLASESGRILPAVLSERVAARLSARTPSDLRFFPTKTATEQGA